MVKSQFETVTAIRVSVEDLTAFGLEVRHLREKVDELQAVGTAQLSASRAACFEASAQRVEQVAAEYSQNEQAQRYAALYAEAIREMAKR